MFDWTVPKEWNIRDAYIKNSRGERIVDFKASNLHVVNYSMPVHTRMSLEALRPHLHSIPEHPEWIPYKTVVLRGDMGLLPAAASARVASGGRLRGLHRLDARAWPPHARTMRRRRREQRGGARLVPQLPPVAVQRQPVGHLGRRDAGAAAGRRRRIATRIAFSSFLARSARSRGWRVTRRTRRDVQAWPGPRLRRRSWQL